MGATKSQEKVIINVKVSWSFIRFVSKYIIFTTDKCYSLMLRNVYMSAVLLHISSYLCKWQLFNNNISYCDKNVPT